MNRLLKRLLIAMISTAFLTGCSTTPRSAASAATLTADAEATLTSFLGADSTLQPVLDRSAGYAVFPNVGKGAWIVGGAFGRGVVYERGRAVGWADVTKLSVGLQGGAQSFRQILVFLTPERMEAFKGRSFALTGSVSAVALTAGAAGTTNPSAAVIAIVQTRGGLMAEAAVGGQRMRFVPNAGT